MRAKQFIRKIYEAKGDDAGVVVAEVIKLIGEGHTEVSPDVITTKVSAALGRPFMLKDLVAANNASPELQHYIDSINPTKIKFSTDILTVKNQDPVKAKEKAEAGVASMAARAASRPRLGESKLNEATEEETWQGWKIRYETKPQIAGQPLRWMVWHTKRGTESAHEGQANTPQEAIEAAKAWILSGGNAKEITTSTVTIDFNVKFATDIVNGNDFYAKIIQGPTLIISSDAKPGFKRSHIRTQKSKATESTTMLPMISLSNSEATAAGLKAHGRYLLGDTQQNPDGTVSFPLIYQDTVQDKSDKVRLGKPALTVAMNREVSGLEETDRGISKSAETKFHKKLDTLVHNTFGKRPEEMKEGVTSPEIKQAYKDIFKTEPHTPERRAAVERYQSLRKQAMDAKKEVHENAEELNIGDDVIITGPMEFKGETGVIDSFSQDNRFVIVNLYNHGRHSFHSSDVSYNDYADSDAEEAEMYDRDPDFRKWADTQVDESFDQVKKVFKNKAGEAVGEIGIDPEASPGGGQWYVKHYASGYDVVGFDDANEAKEELMYVHKHGLSEGWESGPDEPRERERDPDWEYDQRRQEKADAPYAKKEPEAKSYQVVDLTTKQPVSNQTFATKGDAMAYIMQHHSKNLAYRAIYEGRETPLRDKEDYQAKKKALQDIQMDPHTSKDSELSAEVIRRLAGLEKQRSELK